MRTTGLTRATHAAVCLVAVLLLATTTACAHDARTVSVDAVVPVDLANFRITLPAHVRPGLIEFALSGIGPTMHELIVARTDSSASALALAPGGIVDDQTGRPGFHDLAERE